MNLTSSHPFWSVNKGLPANYPQSKKLLKGEAGTLKSTYALISEPLPAISEWQQQCLIWESGTAYLYLWTTTEGVSSSPRSSGIIFSAGQIAILTYFVSVA